MSALPYLSLDHPAQYRICVQGSYERRWLGLLSGVWVITRRDAAQPDITTFVGRVADQAALLGVLEELYSLGLPLLSVEWLADERTNHSAQRRRTAM